MQRKELIKQFFDKSSQLTVKNNAYQICLTELFRWLVKTDEVKNDITTKTLQLHNKKATASIIAKQNGIIAGIEEVNFLIHSLIFPIFLITHNSSIKNGSSVKTGNTIMQLSGPADALLSYERTILNILGRMSGIATQTNSFILQLTIPPYIAATRKTPWMLLDKKAVAVGGGLTHRLNLRDGIMIKDNHLSMISIEKALEQILPKHQWLEIEIQNIYQANTVLSYLNSYNIQHTTYNILLMLDNWKPSQAQQFIKHVKKTPLYNRILFEASGNITAKSIKQWAQTGVDVVSIGALTHSSINFDLTMSFQ